QTNQAVEMEGNGIQQINWVTKYWGKQAFDIYRSNPLLSFQSRQNIVNYIQSEYQNHIKYNNGAIWGEALKSILGWFHIVLKTNPFNDPQDDDCSQLWINGYASINIRLCPWISDTSLGSPVDIGNSKSLIKIACVDEKGIVT